MNERKKERKKENYTILRGRLQGAMDFFIFLDFLSINNYAYLFISEPPTTTTPAGYLIHSTFLNNLL